MKGILYGIGVGPGDPELLTLKAIKAIAECDIIAVPDSGTEKQLALSIAHAYIGEKPVMPLDMPMTCDRAELKKSREAAADTIQASLDLGKNVGFLTLGDPLIYSTYSYLHALILSRGYKAKVIPGVTSFCAAAAALGMPLCEGSQSLHIIPALYENVENALTLDGTKVLMKSGKKLSELVNQIREKNIDAKMAQRVGMDGERLFYDLSTDIESEYFSIIIVKDSNLPNAQKNSNSTIAQKDSNPPNTQKNDNSQAVLEEVSSKQ